MPIMFVNPAGHRKSASKKRRSKRNKRSSHMARKKRRSVKRGRGGRFVKSRRKSRKRSRARRPKKVVIHFNPAKPKKRRKKSSGKKRARKRGRGGKRRSSKRRKSKAKRMGTKRLMKMLRKRGYAVKSRSGKRKGKRTKKAGTRTRVGHYMAAQRRPATYVIGNPSRRRRKHRKNPSRRRRHRRNPHRRSHRRYRRNPSFASFMTLVKQAAPVVAGIVIGKIATREIAKRVSAVSKLGSFQGAALSAGMLFLGGIATSRIKPLQRFQGAIMMGLGINLITEVLAMTPLKGYLGLGEGIY